MRHLLSLLVLLPSIAMAAAPKDAKPRKYAVPVGPFPIGHNHEWVEPHGDVYKGLGVPTIAMASQVNPLPHAQDAGVERRDVPPGVPDGDGAAPAAQAGDGLLQGRAADRVAERARRP